MKNPTHIALSIADARWLQGFLASQHDKAGDPRHFAQRTSGNRMIARAMASASARVSAVDIDVRARSSEA